MKKRFWMLAAAALLCLLPFNAIAEKYIGTYEISYMYNSMSHGEKPIGSLEYNSIFSAPVKLTLEPGSYYTTFVKGRITGNDFYDYGYKASYDAYVPLLNAGSVYPNTGFNGGNTDPTHNDPTKGWWYMVAGWVGTSEMEGSVFRGGSFDIGSGQSLWLYWTDSYILDNLGGVTVEIYQTSTVPEPATMLLLGFGILGLAGLRRFRK